MKNILDLFKPYTMKVEKNCDFDIHASDLFAVKESGKFNNSVRGDNSINILADLASKAQQEDVLNFVFDTNPVKSVYFYRPIEKMVYDCGQKIKRVFSNLKFVQNYKRNNYYQKYLDYSNVEKLDYARFLLTVDCIQKIVENDIMNAFSVAQGG